MTRNRDVCAGCEPEEEYDLNTISGMHKHHQQQHVAPEQLDVIEEMVNALQLVLATQPPELRRKSDRLLNIFLQAHSTFVAKNTDYGDSFAYTFRRYGLQAPVIRLTDKFKRIEALVDKKALVKDETILDTILDMGNYSFMTIMENEIFVEETRRAEQERRAAEAQQWEVANGKDEASTC